MATFYKCIMKVLWFLSSLGLCIHQLCVAGVLHPANHTDADGTGRKVLMTNLTRRIISWSLREHNVLC